MRGSRVDEVDLLAVEVQPHAVFVGDDRECVFGIRLLPVLRCHHVDDAALRHVLARVLVGDDLRAGRAEGEVPLRVVEVPVRIDRVVDGSAPDRLDGGVHLRDHLGELVVHDEHAVFPDGDADVAADPEQHVEVVRDLLRPDLRRLEVPAEPGQQLVERHDVVGRGDGQAETRQQANECASDVLHGFPPGTVGFPPWMIARALPQSGRPRMRFATMFNCTSDVPPSMEFAFERSHCLVLPSSRSSKPSPVQPTPRVPIMDISRS